MEKFYEIADLGVTPFMETFIYANALSFSGFDTSASCASDNVWRPESHLFFQIVPGDVETPLWEAPQLGESFPMLWTGLVKPSKMTSGDDGQSAESHPFSGAELQKSHQVSNS